MVRALLFAAAVTAQPAFAIFGIETDPDKIEANWKKERIEALAKDRDPEVRIEAARFLGSRDDPESIAALGAALSDRDAGVRQAAASALWSTGKRATAARPQLVAALDDPDPNVVARVAGALEAMGMKEAELADANQRAFNAPEASVDSRFLVSRSLVGREPGPRLLEAMLAYLAANASSRGDAGKHNTELAAKALESLAKSKDPSLAAPLMDAARTAKAGQDVIVKTIRALKPQPPGLALLAVQLLDSPDPKVRYAALGAMRDLRTKSDVDIWSPRAADMLRDPDSSVRNEAAVALGYGGGLAADHVDKLAEALRDPSGAVRAHAAEAIGNMGDRKQAVPAAVKARVAQVGRPALMAIVDSDPQENVRREAKDALAKLGEAGGAPVATAVRASESTGMAVLRQRGVTFEDVSFYRALNNVDVELVRAFLDAGMSVNDSVVDRGPPLRVMLFSSTSCNPRERPTKAATKEAVKLLLERGADVNGVDTYSGDTALMEASSHGCDREVMRMLIKAGAKVNVKNAVGLTPFEMGLLWGHDGLEEIIAAGYRLPPDKAKQYEQAYAGKPAVQAMIRKASAK
jgi:HEAT repeat protein